MSGKTTAALALALVAGASTAAGSQCPNEKATYCPARVEEIGGRDCGLGVTIGGVLVAFRGPHCPRYRVTTPPHGCCKGVFSEGERCVAAGSLAVTVERCFCLSFGCAEYALHLPLCVCGAKGNLGFIENEATVPC